MDAAVSGRNECISCRGRLEGILANQRYRSGRGLLPSQWEFKLLTLAFFSASGRSYADSVAGIALLYVLHFNLSAGPCHGLGSYRPLTTESQVHSHTINMGFVVNKVAVGGVCL